MYRAQPISKYVFVVRYFAGTSYCTWYCTNLYITLTVYFTYICYRHLCRVIKTRAEMVQLRTIGWCRQKRLCPDLGPHPNWAMIRLCRLKWPLIRLSRPKLPLIRPSRPKWSLIRLSRPKCPLIRPIPDHCPDYSALMIRPKFRPLSRL